LYRRHRFPAEVVSNAVWLYFRFPLSLRMVEDMLAMRGIVVSHETVRRWAEKFGRDLTIADKLRSYGAARNKMRMKFEHRQHKGLNNCAENYHQPTRHESGL